jgi:hypothetical protein
MMRTTVGTQPQIIIVVCCITLRRSAYDMEALRLCVYGGRCSRFFLKPAKTTGIPACVLCKVCVVFFTMLW